MGTLLWSDEALFSQDVVKAAALQICCYNISGSGEGIETVLFLGAALLEINMSGAA
jgi:hypothetical protein